MQDPAKKTKISESMRLCNKERPKVLPSRNVGLTQMRLKSLQFKEVQGITKYKALSTFPSKKMLKNG